MRKLYLITTEHLKVGLWFRDESDFRTGMNFVAIQAYRSKVTVLAFILMSNHLHFVVEGRFEDVKAFIDGIKSRYSKYLNHKYGTSEFLRQVQRRFCSNVHQIARVTGLTYEEAARMMDSV